MNKLLRNPWVVAALVLGMAALWWVEMRAMLYPGVGLADEAPSAVSTSPNAETAAVEPLVSDAAPTLRAGRATQLRADSTPSRDPFGPADSAAPLAVATPVVIEPQSAPVELEPVEILPALEAVLNTPSAHIAVVDGRIVRVGDKVNGRAVLRIDNAAVALGADAADGTPLVLKLPSR